MFLVGLTVSRKLNLSLHVDILYIYIYVIQGGVATGKSTVSNMFRDLGIPVIDADAMARRIVEPGRTAWRAIK